MISKAACGLAIATLTAALNEKDAEIERLRGLLGDVQIILDSHNNIVGNLNGEITRLRGLLRDRGWAEGTAEWMEWERKVQEALGK